MNEKKKEPERSMKGIQVQNPGGRILSVAEYLVPELLKQGFKLVENPKVKTTMKAETVKPKKKVK